jgi:HEAT repeat protein
MGKDHDVVLEALAALGKVRSDAAVPALVAMSQRRKFFGGKKLRALKERSVASLVEIGTPKADGALREAAKSGDGLLKKIVAATRH